jgi:hypothetical protein
MDLGIVMTGVVVLGAGGIMFAKFSSSSMMLNRQHPLAAPYAVVLLNSLN